LKSEQNIIGSGGYCSVLIRWCIK